MGVYKAVPDKFAETHPRYLTPTWATTLMGLVSIILYVAMNYISAGTVISDAVSALAVMVAFYYGLTGFTCVWFYRDTLFQGARNLWFRGIGARNLWFRGIIPLAGGLILWAAMGYNLWYYWKPENSYTSWQMTFWPHWHMGGIFVLDMLAVVVGVILLVAFRIGHPAFFRGETLNASTPTLVPEDIGQEVGMFGIREA
jgi:amino acid transporter